MEGKSAGGSTGGRGRWGGVSAGKGVAQAKNAAVAKAARMRRRFIVAPQPKRSWETWNGGSMSRRAEFRQWPDAIGLVTMAGEWDGRNLGVERLISITLGIGRT